MILDPKASFRSKPEKISIEKISFGQKEVAVIPLPVGKRSWYWYSCGLC